MKSDYPVQLWVGAERFDPRRVTRVQNTVHSVKPHGGLWTSSLIEDAVGWESDWTRFCQTESFRLEKIARRTALVACAQARIYTIDSLDDLLALSRECGSYDSLIDFERAAQHYDIIRLTEQGQWQTRFSSPSLYGWDCECSLWLNPAIALFCQVR